MSGPIQKFITPTYVSEEGETLSSLTQEIQKSFPLLRRSPKSILKALRAGLGLELEPDELIRPGSPISLTKLRELSQKKREREQGLASPASAGQKSVERLTSQQLTAADGETLESIAKKISSLSQALEGKKEEILKKILQANPQIEDAQSPLSKGQLVDLSTLAKMSRAASRPGSHISEADTAFEKTARASQLASLSNQIKLVLEENNALKSLYLQGKQKPEASPQELERQDWLTGEITGQSASERGLDFLDPSLSLSENLRALTSDPLLQAALEKTREKGLSSQEKQKRFKSAVESAAETELSAVAALFQGRQSPYMLYKKSLKSLKTYKKELSKASLPPAKSSFSFQGTALPPLASTYSQPASVPNMAESLPPTAQLVVPMPPVPAPSAPQQTSTTQREDAAPVMPMSSLSELRLLREIVEVQQIEKILASVQEGATLSMKSLLPL